MLRLWMGVLWIALLSLAACDDGGRDRYGSDSDYLGVGAQCADDEDCLEDQRCLSFKGGYCGVRDCVDDLDCPEDSACVAHDDGVNYCFRICTDKIDCNVNRDVDLEANCSSSVDFVEGKGNKKACVPPS